VRRQGHARVPNPPRSLGTRSPHAPVFPGSRRQPRRPVRHGVGAACVHAGPGTEQPARHALGSPLRRCTQAAVPGGRSVCRGPGRGLRPDRSSQSALLKFEDGAEVFALHPTPGPRGRRDLAERRRPAHAALHAVGRTNAVHPGPADWHAGGLHRADQGAAASRDGPRALLRQLASASARASRAARRLLPFEAPQVQRGEEPLYADAAATGGRGRGSGDQHPQGPRRRRASPTRALHEGDAPSAVVNDDTLEIVLAPQKGLAGRPSSKRRNRPCWSRANQTLGRPVEHGASKVNGAGVVHPTSSIQRC
jgi:hypothetical protein